MVVNKLPPDCPRSKIAILKRAYRGQPSSGFCPMPEPGLTLDDPANQTRIRCMEQLLHYFHSACKDAAAALETEQLRAAFLANVDVSAVEAMSKHKEKDQYLKGMRQATWRWLGQLESANGTKMLQANPAWLLRALWEDEAKEQYTKNKNERPCTSDSRSVRIRRSRRHCNQCADRRNS